MLEKEDIAAYLFKEQVNLTAYIGYLTMDFQAAEDIFQDVSIKAISTADTFKDVDHLRRWSLVVGRNGAVDWLRRRKRQSMVMDSQLMDVIQGEWPSQARDDKSVSLEALASCMDSLTDYNRELLDLRYFQSLSGSEIARRLQRKVETVYQALTRIHRRLENCVRRRLIQETR